MTDQTQPETINQPELRTVVPGTAVCPHCSTLIEPEAKTCPGCGAKKHVGATGVQELITYTIMCAINLDIEHYNHWHIYYLLLSIRPPIIGNISQLLVGGLILIAANIFCKFRYKKQIKWIRNKKQNPIKKP